MVRRTTRNLDWGFPRWRAYGGERGAAQVRLCDREGCGQAGDRPAPKSPNSPDRWWFCEEHAAEYNKGWNYFEGLSAEEAAAREAGDSGERAYRRAKHWSWGEGDGTRSRAELDALKALELDSDATEAQIKAAHRRLAKKHHPDNGGDVAAFQAVQAAYEILTRPRA
ncbi:DnaJ domain-containing protein [Bradyrhizobium sp.]|uniref:DnaJ domain-containing protein n=1 Tax=Bradyrhizobium sp. TaxID=376 RepID=UPI0025B9C9DC|nr:DnaJ domain-containing protein [Bradyrhizobium sp.]MCA3571141.1 DnaJ domain-containing protein [Bradyrhizobium sp.]